MRLNQVTVPLVDYAASVEFYRKLGYQVDREMRPRPRRRRDTDRDEQRKNDLPEIVGLPRVPAKQITQRPLQEQ